MSQTDGVTITYERRFTPEALSALAAERDALLRGLSGAPGFRGLRLVRHKDDAARHLVVEHWDDEPARAAHLASGAAHPLHASAEEAEVWPRLVASGGEARGPEGVTITFELQLVPAAVEPFLGAGAKFEKASAFPGFRGIRMVQHKSDPTRVLFIERWDSEAAYQAYVNFRDERGEMDGLKQIAPMMRTDVWPELVVEA